MTMTTFLDDLKGKVGRELGVSDWIRMTQGKFDGFAEITGDSDWLHNDPERCAKESPFGSKTIAQGHLLLAHLSHVAVSLMPDPGGHVIYSLNYGYDRVRFIRPVTVDSRIRGRLILKEIRTKGGGRYVIETDATLEVDGSEEPSVAARWLFLTQLA
jgi:acyl dehydratase